MATGAIDDKIFVIGGTESNNQPTNRVERFNDKEDEWLVYS
jgi:hypothetical protein